MSDEVRTWIDIRATPGEVLEAALDPERLHEWVTIHRQLHDHDGGRVRLGHEMEQTLILRGAPFRVRWTLTALRPPTDATWTGRGPAGSTAVTSYHVQDIGDGASRFHYLLGFRAPAGGLGRAVTRALVGDTPRQEAEHSLRRLKERLERPPADEPR